MTENLAASVMMVGLKDFQRRTVNYAFGRMFDPVSPARRFLVADEVGLGKTLVAKGLIARTIDHMRMGGERVDVIYVCSNAEIAAQNIRRLMLPGQPAFAHATRLTLLPLITARLRENAVNLISFTPGTTFNQGRRTGRKEERRLIYQMLIPILLAPNMSARGFRHALKGAAGEQWDKEAEEPLEFDQDIAGSFRKQILEDSILFDEVRDISWIYCDRRKSTSDADEIRCLELIGLLRRRLAKTCLSALKPSLVILDEFQRFGELFEDPEQNPSAELAHELFNYSNDLRVLLLSATPYKMYARDDEGEDHYVDFLRTLQFLMPGEVEQIDSLKRDISLFRTGLLASAVDTDFESLRDTKERIENTLKRVMCRTERVSATVRADAMVKEIFMLPDLRPDDLHDFKALETVRDRLGERETIEYWKSSPYLLNFMRDYGLKVALREDQKRKISKIADLIEGKKLKLLRMGSVERYKVLDPANARTRALMAEIDSQGLWRLLWMPPSLNYWQAAGEFKDIGPVTKHLVFSAWNVVPDTLAALLSFEVERRLVKRAGGSVAYSRMPKKYAAQLRFSGHRDGRPGAMSALLLAFPSQALVKLIDPLVLLQSLGQSPTFGELRVHSCAVMSPAIEAVIDRSVTEGPVDQRWYWVTLARLESKEHKPAREWCESHWARARGARMDDESDSVTGFQAHLHQWLEAWEGNTEELGRVPIDLVEVLADVALAAPATCALRTLKRQWPQIGETPFAMLSAAARIAEGLRSQFNSPRAVALLKAADDDDSYWQRVLQYSADGNLQALLDEYAHVLYESHGLAVHAAEKSWETLAEAMYEPMSLRTATLRPDDVSIRGGRLQIAPFDSGMRTHFALRYGSQDAEDGAVARKESVQAAFNSPFWPFVLASTSVGQEGLDFHTWCHSVVHWNLPSNPVDMEQREGRVHRYKGYAVRKNVAASYGERALRRNDRSSVDLWGELFELAVAGRSAGSNDLAPFWVCEKDGGASVERRIMVLPFSRDEARYRRLKRSLALYRMVFAQPRQEDLLACLEQTISDETAAVLGERWRICLAPPDENISQVTAGIG